MNVAAARLFGYGFPFGTLIVNVVGSFVIGLLAGYFAFRPGIPREHAPLPDDGNSRRLHDFFRFSLDAALLVERHSYALAAGYIAGSVGVSIVALFLGLALFERRIPLP